MPFTANSYQTFNGDASNRDFVYSFSKLATTHIKVYVDGVEKTSGTHWDEGDGSGSGTAGSVYFRSGHVPPVGTDNVKVERVTPKEYTNRSVDFSANAYLSETDLETNQQNMFYLVQEAIESDDNDPVQLLNMTLAAETQTWDIGVAWVNTKYRYYEIVITGTYAASGGLIYPQVNGANVTGLDWEQSEAATATAFNKVALHGADAPSNTTLRMLTSAGNPTSSTVVHRAGVSALANFKVASTSAVAGKMVPVGARVIIHGYSNI